MNIEGDLIVVLSDGDFVSFADPFVSDGRRLVEIRGGHLPPRTLPNVARDLIAYELGHAIGLGHNDDRCRAAIKAVGQYGRVIPLNRKQANR
jgi:hypothetical protein